MIVSDVMMPRLDGIELVALLKRDPLLAGVPVLLLTARAGRDALVGGLGAGADDYLVKPFAAAELVARVSAAHRMHRLCLDCERQRDELDRSLARLQDTQAQLVDAAKMAAVGTLMGGLAHELNNPLSVILMNAQMLAERAGDATLRRGAATIERQALRCARLLTNLAAISRAPPSLRGEVGVDALCERALAPVRPRAERKGVALAVEIAANLPSLSGDASELQAALLHVLGNALDAAPRGGSVSLVAEPRALHGAPGVEIAVRDDGPGIPPPR